MMENHDKPAAPADSLAVAICQPLIVPGEVETNLGRIAEMALRAAAGGAQLAAFGECSVTGYDFRGRGVGAALRADDPRILAVHERFREAGVAVVVGLFERADGGLFNSALALLPDGRRVVQRKRQLTQYERGAGLRPLAGGWEPFAFAGFRLGMIVCADAGDPEPYDTFRAAGCDATVLITAGLGRLDQGFRGHELGDPERRRAYEALRREVTVGDGPIASVRDAGMGQVAINLATADEPSDCFHCGSGSIADRDGRVIVRLDGELIIERLRPESALGVLPRRAAAVAC